MKQRLVKSIAAIVWLIFAHSTFAGTTWYDYDEAGQVQHIATQTGALTGFQYDGAGNRSAASTSVDPSSRSTDVTLTPSLPGGQTEVVVGNEIRVLFTIGNAGPDIATGVSIDIAIGGNYIDLLLADVTPGCTVNPVTSSLACEPGIMEVGDSIEVGIYLRPTGPETTLGSGVFDDLTFNGSAVLAEPDTDIPNHQINFAIPVVASGNPGDTDGDGIPDAWETVVGLDPFDASDALQDPDSDGLSNLGEFLAGTDPNNPDTDGDGIEDGEDVNPTFNPADIVPILRLLLD